MLTCQSSVGYKLNFAASYKFGKEYSKEEFERSETLYNIACMSDLLYILVSARGSTWHGGYCGGTILLDTAHWQHNHISTSKLEFRFQYFYYQSYSFISLIHGKWYRADIYFHVRHCGTRNVGVLSIQK